MGAGKSSSLRGSTVTGWRGGREKQWEICYLHLGGETTVIDSTWGNR